MSASHDHLDPESAQLAAKIRRLMMISGATTLVAVGAVLAVIGYRVFRAEGSAAPAAALVDVTARLPRGATVVGTAVVGERIAVTVQTDDGGFEIRTFDAATLRPAGRLRFVNEP